MKSTYTAKYRVLLSRLVDARKVAGMTQADLAAKIGRPQSFVSKIENGERRIDVIEFIEVTLILGTDVESILKGLTGYDG